MIPKCLNLTINCLHYTFFKVVSKFFTINSEEKKRETKAKTFLIQRVSVP